ncbi:DUF1648 domain-containing protein [Clostridium sp. Mt-5]|uniref:DUF1648 domain-containing protein n=1 Tax=Clostridium moutaii TaxID=3240932 RepID=A0ABV4BUA7_9CLOT
MNENLFMCIYLFFIFIIILVITILTPKFTRKEIVFGVRVPEDEADSDEIKHIKTQFIRNNLVVEIPFILLFSFLNYKFLNVGMILFTTFAFVFINFLVYMISNRAVKNLKLQKLWLQGKKQVVTIDIDFSKKKSDMLVSVWFFMIPVFIIIINIILGYTHYSSLPYKVPTHWDFSGNITGYQIKSKFLIWEMPLAQIIITFISFIVYKGIGWSKQQISSLNPEESVKKNSIFRRSWSIYMVILASATDILLSVGTIQIFKVIDVSSAFSNAVIIAFLTITILASIILSLKIGQGGSNIKMGKDSLQRDESELTNKDDDDSWKLANTIYYNPEDPSIFVEKRFGVGWTVNAGRPAGMAIYIGIIIFTIVVIGISIFAQS